MERLCRKNGLRGEALRIVREPKSEAGQAVACTLKNWTALTPYCSDRDLLIGNNGTERSVRSFAAGHNNRSTSESTTAAGLLSFRYFV